MSPWPFKKRVNAYIRGRESAIRFLSEIKKADGDTQDEEIERFWAGACEDEAFNNDGFARGVKEVFRERGIKK